MHFALLCIKSTTIVCIFISFSAMHVSLNLETPCRSIPTQNYLFMVDVVVCVSSGLKGMLCLAPIARAVIRQRTK